MSPKRAAPNFNLNLLLALDGLLGVTAAARRVGVTPSAMSHSLAELRSLLGDLVRAGRGMVLTPRGEALVAPLRRLLGDTERLLRGGITFDPLTAERRFRQKPIGTGASTRIPAIAGYGRW
jgi:DNA-binding transcriptional LysR family regulator